MNSHQGRQSFLLLVLEMEPMTSSHTKQLLITELCFQPFDIFIWSGHELSDKKLANVISHSLDCLHPVVLCCAEFTKLMWQKKLFLAVGNTTVWRFRKNNLKTGPWSYSLVQCLPSMLKSLGYTVGIKEQGNNNNKLNQILQPHFFRVQIQRK